MMIDIQFILLFETYQNTALTNKLSLYLLWPIITKEFQSGANNKFQPSAAAVELAVGLSPSRPPLPSLSTSPSPSPGARFSSPARTIDVMIPFGLKVSTCHK